ncbi:MAG: fibrillarin-like rRNA/tRNA 2'-O-methyltransferase [Euryarchaeota archaeon]|nr:fibrillarin-like rRNA/tRNA 2'-O-methyltransferase [Euryarchaeota archaeon]
MRERFDGVFEFEDRRLATRNLVPGVAVYGERLVRRDGAEFREWNPQRSKPAAMILKGASFFPIRENSRILYLGASYGTTPSHFSDIAAKGIVYALEFSTRSFRDLLMMSQRRRNLIPILADAMRPEAYARLVGEVDILYQDISQRNQVGIFLKNAQHFRPRFGVLMVKARSVDVAREPKEIFKETEDSLQQGGAKLIEAVNLAPFEDDHASVAVEFKP